MTLTPVIMDVDTGIDDAFALMFAVRHPEIDLRAVTCVAGNAGVDQVVANTRYVLDAAGAGEIPVGRGAAAPLLVAAADAGHFHGADGLGGFSRPSDRRISPFTAVDLLRHELSDRGRQRRTDHPGGHRAADQHRAAAAGASGGRRRHRTAGVHGRLRLGAGNVTAVAEFNVFHDPEAAAITLAAARDLDIPVTMYGLDVFEQVLVDRQDAARLHGRLDPACQLAGALIASQCDKLGVDAITIGDAGTVCAVVDPDGLTTHRHPVRVETGYGYARGQTMVDRREQPSTRCGCPASSHPPRWTSPSTWMRGGYAGLWLRTLLG